MTVVVRIQQASFDLAQEEALILNRSDDAGALVAFQGLVRAHDETEPLAALYLEHFPKVTEAEIGRIVALARKRWPFSACTVIHRVGRLVINAPIVLVLVASTHRLEAFCAAEFIMDYLKTEAPFWKQEQFVNGHSRWVEAKKTDTAMKARWS